MSKLTYTEINMFNEQDMDRLIEEDVPYIDLTSLILGIDSQEALITYKTREEIVVCGTEECLKIFKRFNIEPLYIQPSGSELHPGEKILVGKGKGKDIHKVWKICQNLLEYTSGIATRTRKLVKLVKSVNPNGIIGTTRKTFPLGKKVCIKGVICGGALPHRLNLSETVLIFKNHIKLVGPFEEFLKRIPEIKNKVPEKKIIVEAETIDEALALITANVDIVQLDKFSVEAVKEVVSYKNKKAPHIKIAVAGGLNEQNIVEYASTEADIFVLTFPYFGKPADIKVEIEKLKKS
jgi:molybdenum transport protein